MLKRFAALLILALMVAPGGATEARAAAGPLERGVENLREENYEEAVEDLTAAREAEPDSALAAYYLGVAYKKVQDLESARAHLEDAVGGEPAVREAVVELADLYYQTGEEEKALDMIELAEEEGIKPAETVFLRGLVMARLGRYEQAVESFEKAAGLDPELTAAAEYQIGSARYSMGRLEGARESFKDVMERAPEGDLALFAGQYLETIDKRLEEEGPLGLSASVSLVYDDNVLLKPEDAAVAGDVTNEDDYGAAGSFRAEYSPRARGPWSFRASYGMRLVDYSKLSSHDYLSHNLTASPARTTKWGTATLPVSYNYTLVDDDGYLQSGSFAPAWSVALDAGRFARARAFYRKKEYIQEPLNEDEDRDSIEAGAGADLYQAVAGGEGYVRVGYAFTHGDTDGTNWRFRGHAVSASMVLPLTERVTVNAGAEADFQDFTEAHTVFGVKREDSTYTLFAAAAFALTDRVDVTAHYTHIRGNSNVSIYDYERNILSAGVEAGF